MRTPTIFLFLTIILISCSRQQKVIGCWLDHNSWTYEFKDDGTFYAVSKDGEYHENGKWKLIGDDKLNCIFESKNANYTHTIENLDAENMVIKFNGMINYTWTKLNCSQSSQISKKDESTDSKSSEATTSYAEWFTLNIDESKYGFKYDRSGNVLFNDKIVDGIKVRKTTEKIYVSPIAGNGQYVLCFTYGDYIGEFLLPGFFICNLNSLKASVITLEGPPLLWHSWSPKSTNVIVGSYYEADMTLYNLDIGTRSLTKMEFPADIKKDDSGGPLEEITYTTNSLNWTSETVFNISANINCNPYGDSKCDNDTRNNILRSYIFTYDIDKNKCTNRILNKTR